jgi:hypothetical protein
MQFCKHKFHVLDEYHPFQTFCNQNSPRILASFQKQAIDPSHVNFATHPQTLPSLSLSLSELSEEWPPN